jgi:hypothetical protein
LRSPSRVQNRAVIRCSLCKREISRDDLARDASKSTGVRTWCRRCDGVLRLDRRRRNAEPRACKFCGRPIRVPRARVCDVCRPAYTAWRRKQRGVTSLSAEERGYDAAHQRERKRVKKLVEAAGGAVCWRCGGWFDASEPWDLGHVDGDMSRYAGPEHRACNRATAGRHKRRSVPRTTSRVW